MAHYPFRQSILLSNGFGIHFDLVFSAEQVEYYGSGDVKQIARDLSLVKKVPRFHR